MDTLTETPQPRILPISEIDSMDSYLKNYGRILGKKAVHALAPLHVPGRDPLPSFEDIVEFAPHRDPFPCQAHVVAAAVKMMNTIGSGFIVGEMGTGKTLLGMLSAHKHAQQSRRQGGLDGKYRAIVLCPDHLISKWCREIEETIPDAVVTRFGPQGGDEVVETKGRRKKGDPKPDTNSKATLRDIVALFDKGNGERWEKPQGAEWYVLGRNQAKWLSDWAGMADERMGFDAVSGALCQATKVEATGKTDEGTLTGSEVTYYVPRPPAAAPMKNALSSKSRPVDQVTLLDERGMPQYDKYGRPLRKNVLSKVHYCPKCGNIVRNKKGEIVGTKDLTSGKNVAQKTCKATYLQMLPSGPDKPSHGLDRISPIPARFEAVAGKIGHEISHAGYKWVVRECNEPLYNYTARPYRWSPARIIQKKLRRFFQYLIIDEVHEQKSDESAQSMACGKLIGSVQHVLALTGTIIGGYANHLYPLMMRLTPKSLRDEGFEWGKDMAFVEAYGKIDRIVTTKEDDDGDVSVRGNVKSMRRAKSGSRSERKAVRPGVMPTMFGRHMIGSSMFITLEEMASELTDLFEYVGGGLAPEPTIEVSGEHYDADLDRWERLAAGWNETAIDMEPDQEAEYKRVMAILEFANKELLKKGSMKLLGAYLWTLLDYPDRPFGWDYDAEVMKAAAVDENQPPSLLGQAFLGKFNHEYDAATETLLLTPREPAGAETDRVPLKKDGGVYMVDVSINGKPARQFVYDTGAALVSMGMGLASELGLRPKKGDGTVTLSVASGATLEARLTTLDSVRVGKFTIRNVECAIKPPSGLTHTVGYWDKPGNRKIENFVGVVTPKSLPEDVIYPKEQALIDICKKQKQDGRQSWVYVQMSGKRNIQPRIAKLLEAEGLKVGILRSDDVEPIEREDWIARNGRDYDVMISHPQLVSTGLDLFSKKQGGHNYSTLIFYETGYNLFTMRQAARRAWRIGQPRDCRVYYLYYKETMQHKAMSLMSRKMAAAQALEGEFSEEGLAAMAGEDNLQMALAKNLAGRIDDSDMQRSWNKVKSGPKKVKRPTEAVKEIAGKVEPKPSKLDELPIELQLIGESILENQGKPVPPEALEEFPRLHEAINGHSHKDGDADTDEVNEEFAKREADIDDPADDEELEALAEKLVAEAAEGDQFDTAFDEDFDDVPELTEDVLAKMFANMVDNGLMV